MNLSVWGPEKVEEMVWVRVSRGWESRMVGLGRDGCGCGEPGHGSNCGRMIEAACRVFHLLSNIKLINRML